MIPGVTFLNSFSLLVSLMSLGGLFHRRMALGKNEFFLCVFFGGGEGEFEAGTLELYFLVGDGYKVFF